MPKRFIDLHTHSSASDGGDSPAELVRKAAALGLFALALTDHDTLAGLDEAEEEAQRVGIELVRGCEIAVSNEGEELHIMGLWIPSRPPQVLLDALKAGRNRRLDRNARMLDRLQELGLEVGDDELLQSSGGEVVGRPHMAGVLLRKQYVTTRKEAFERYLGRDGAAYVPRTLPTPEEGIGALRAAGALTVLAHPCLSSRMTPDLLQAHLQTLADCGLDALEAYHSSHNNANVRLCLEYAERFRLGVSGGSDYHGAAKPGIRLGHAGDGMVIPAHILDQLKARLQARA